MKNRSLLKIILGVLTSGLLVSCMGLEETAPSSLAAPEINEFEVTDNGSLVFELNASVDKSLAGRIASCGFYYGKDKSMSGAEKIECKMLGGSFSADLTLREYGETYYICSFISNGSGSNEILSDPERVQLKDLDAYVEFGTPEVVSYDRETEKMFVRVSCSPKTGVDVSKWGVCHGESEKLSVDSNSIEDKNIEDGIINVVIDDVPVGTALFVRPYVYDNGNLAYGDAVCLNAHAVPAVEISEVMDITNSGVSISASVSDDGGMPIKARGVVYISGDGEPTIGTGVNVLVEGGVGEFIVNLSDLAPNQTYSIRAYAQNDKGVTYSEKRTFTTKIGMPQVQTTIHMISGIGLTSATLEANIVSDGGEPISECGFYLCKGNMFSDDTAVRYVCGNSSMSFSYAVSGLEQATEYSFKAFAVNSVGESVGEPICFTTKATIEYALTLPDDTYVWFSGIVVGETSRGFLLSDDDSNMLYVYCGNSWSESDVKIGDCVTVGGTMATYYNNRELTLQYASFERRTASVPESEAYKLTSSNIKSFVDENHKPCKITVTGQVVKDGSYYNILLGDECVASPNFPVVDMDQYVGDNATLTGYYLWTSTNSDNKYVVSFVLTEVFVDIGLNLGSPANCYIVSDSGRYNFQAVKGNSNVSVGSVKSVEVLWESFGTSTVPDVGDLIKSVSYIGGYIVFRTADTFKEGNAVIAAKDASGKILWSWHIWLTDEPGECVYANNAGTMMDRNLGATSATPGDVGALGLLYQWGRKDPFLGSSSISDRIEAKSTMSGHSFVMSSMTNGTIDYSIAHPTTFIMGNNNSAYDWCYQESNANDDRWQTVKTIYDPCPRGWRVPDGGLDSPWTKANLPYGMSGEAYDSICYYDSVNSGMVVNSPLSIPASWYPCAGCRGRIDGALDQYQGYYWSATSRVIYSLSACSLRIGSSWLIGEYVTPSGGYSIRCLKE